MPDDLETILQKCDEKSVPVFIDMAYLNIAQGMEINLDHPCIEYVASSLSKAFPVELNRIGIRLQKKKFEDQLYVINEDGYNYINLQNCYVGTELMKNFPADYTSKKYRKKQSEYCDKMQLTPSRCVIFGIDYNNKYPEYKRLNDTARLCFSRVWDGRMSI